MFHSMCLLPYQLFTLKCGGGGGGEALWCLKILIQIDVLHLSKMAAIGRLGRAIVQPLLKSRSCVVAPSVRNCKSVYIQPICRITYRITSFAICLSPCNVYLLEF